MLAAHFLKGDDLKGITPINEAQGIAHPGAMANPYSQFLALDFVMSFTTFLSR